MHSEIISYHKIFKLFPDYLHSYLKVCQRYLAFAFETLHYPWIPSFFTSPKTCSQHMQSFGEDVVLEWKHQSTKKIRHWRSPESEFISRCCPATNHNKCPLNFEERSRHKMKKSPVIKQIYCSHVFTSAQNLWNTIPQVDAYFLLLLFLKGICSRGPVVQGWYGEKLDSEAFGRSIK